MGIFDRFKCAGILAKTALILLALASLFVWISFTGTRWIHRPGSHYGLWHICYEHQQNLKCRREFGGPKWDLWSVVQATSTLGFVGINAALALTILYIFVRRFRDNENVAMVTGFICFATGALYFCGILILLTDITADYVRDVKVQPAYIKPKLGHCFYLSLVAQSLGILAGTLILRAGNNVTGMHIDLP